jgi:acyl carrier protein
LAHEDTLGDKRLIAYVVPHQEPGPAGQVETLSITSLLRHFLQDHLPEHMVPSAFVVLPALPLTPNGKVDRQALPAPDGARPDLTRAYVAPRTEVEEELAGIWGEVLGLERVGIHDNFFEVGGHSLLATQVIYRLNDAFELELPLRTLFEKPTIAGLALAIEEVLIEEIEGLTEDEAAYLADVAG